MKPFITLAAALAVVSFSCATKHAGDAGADTRTFRSTDAPFEGVLGKTWNLYSITRGDKTVFLDRKALESDGFAGVFSLTFGGPPVNNPALPPRISGRGAPNTFIATYELGADQGISIGVPAGTLMAPIKEPQQLKEHDYFVLVSNVSAWKLAGGDLILLTSDDAGAEVLLTFVAP
jgi:heat shock protein HslJ